MAKSKKNSKKIKAEIPSDGVCLKLTNPMMHGPSVKRLQEFGDALGVDTGVNDGIFGKDTETAVQEIQAKLGATVDGVCGLHTWAAILEAVDALSSDTDPMVVFMTELDRVHDIRKLHGPPRLQSRRHPVRSWSDINGVTIHQTGCNMPSKPSSWGRLNAHFGITKEGLVIFANDPKKFIWHAQGLSKSTIGIEIEGNYQGLMNDPKTLWSGGGPAATLNPEMYFAIEQLFVLLEWMFKANKKQWWFVHGHRQSAKSRIADPGEEIWKGVALPWMARLNKKWFDENRDGGNDFSLGSGRRIPKDWSPRRASPYWYKR